MPVLPRPLTPIEARVLGVLVEKERTVPDAYPLSLNALVAGCNQKSSRSPPMELADAEVQRALDDLRGLTLVVESSGGRVMRYGHNLPRSLAIPAASTALVAALMLRGPQTPGELRINAERLHKFADVGSLQAHLAELAAREAGAIVVELPRVPGARENRWMHLLCGAPDSPTAQLASVVAPSPGGDDRLVALEARVTRLESLLASLARPPGDDPG